MVCHAQARLAWRGSILVLALDRVGAAGYDRRWRLFGWNAVGEQGGVMKLRLESCPVTALAFGSQTAFRDGTLTINPEEIRSLAGDDTCIADVQVELVSPGEETRIIHVLDALEPR